MVATILLACGVWALVRTGGFTGDFDNDFAWRWSQTPEERLLAQAAEEPAAVPPAPAAAETDANWPGFRGPHRDGVVRGVRIATDWSASPPVELWRRPIGPGWSSFAVRGDRLYTQEQRGADEVVACYNVAFGFAGSNLACIDLKDGERKWKGGRYGNGQLVLLSDQDLLLVLSEVGELALVGATPDQFKELARFPAIEGKTWNHQVLVDDVLLARNGQEMVAFRVSLARP